jgi:hypothetical protein
MTRALFGLDLYAALIGDAVLIQLFEKHLGNAEDLLGAQCTESDFAKGGGWGACKGAILAAFLPHRAQYGGAAGRPFEVAVMMLPV